MRKAYFFLFALAFFAFANFARGDIAVTAINFNASDCVMSQIDANCQPANTAATSAETALKDENSSITDKPVPIVAIMRDGPAIYRSDQRLENGEVNLIFNIDQKKSDPAFTAAVCGTTFRFYLRT